MPVNDIAFNLPITRSSPMLFLKSYLGDAAARWVGQEIRAKKIAARTGSRRERVLVGVAASPQKLPCK
jgi:hypothetical protein